MNQEIRAAIRESGKKQWQIAQQIGIGENTLIRWLRSELDEVRKNAIYKAIEELKAE